MRIHAIVHQSRSRAVRYGSVLGSFLLAGAFLIVSGPPANAAHGCSKPLVIGLHGVGEGPDENGSGKLSVVLTDTMNRLRNLEKQHGYPVAEMRFLRHRMISGQTMTDFGFWRDGSFSEAVKTASRGLSREVTQARNGCPDRRIALIGYSLGAWIVDDYLAQSAGFRQRALSAVVLYGDPEWPSPAPGGLAREFGHVNIDPYKPNGLRGRFMSMCLRHDFVCNVSHESVGTRMQEMAACAIGVSSCAHRRYQWDGATKHGADALFVWTR